jgi:rhodanese-related sulfurtransferase
LERNLSINQYPTKEYFETQAGVPIIDVRTEGEWYQTGILKDAHTLTFFDEMGQYDVDSFLEGLHKIIGEDKEAKFLLICRTGSRTGQIAGFLFQNGYKNVVNLAGGIYYVMQQNSFEIVPYQPK